MHDQFHLWNMHKRQIHNIGKYIHFHEGEIRWMHLGKNIGTELIGKSNIFTRPVLIIKKVYGHSAIIVPLSTKKKQGSYYYSSTASNGQVFSANLAQIKYVDGKRMLTKISSVNALDLKQIKEQLFELIR
jgi:mRNA interferase MazF